MDGRPAGEESTDAQSARSESPRSESARSAWTRDHAARIGRTPATVTPRFDLPGDESATPTPPESDAADALHVWDTWLLRDRHGRVADVDGWRVAFSLTSDADLLPGKRHDVATIRYFYSQDGREWACGGPVFDDASESGTGPLGQRQWAGSALLDDGDLSLYYTAAGEADAEELTYTQRIAGADGPSLRATASGVEILGSWSHRVLLEPDGERYETQAQSRGMTYTFRDPWFYEDPATGRTHLLFEANTPIPADSDACDGDPERQSFNGSVGVAVSPTGDPMDWTLRNPILDAVGVNQELERPHVVRQDGRYYLFVSSHQHTFAPGTTGFDALYGFVAESLTGPYRPLNDSGLVVVNPADAPFQAYSWMAFPHRDGALVQWFLNYPDYASASLDAIADLPEAEQRDRFGGTLGPTLRLSLDGDRTRIEGSLERWRVPLFDEPVTATAGFEPGRTALADGSSETGSAAERGERSEYVSSVEY